MSTCGNDKLLFIHVPKTGGSWATQAMRAAGVALANEGEGHSRLRDLDKRGRFTFAFVREPLSWYGSVWSFRRKHSDLQDGEPPWGGPITSFPSFLTGCIDKQPDYLRWMYQSFAGGADFIGRYESSVDDLVTALELAGQDFCEETMRAFPPVNVSGPPPECPEELRVALRESERGAYERFYSPVLA